MPSAWRFGWSVVATLGCGLACRPATHGTIPDDLLAPGPATRAAILVTPSDCLGCNHELTQWLLLRQRHPAAIRVVLTRRPTAAERRALLLQRVVPDTVLAGEPRQALPVIRVWLADSFAGQHPITNSEALLRAVQTRLDGLK